MADKYRIKKKFPDGTETVECITKYADRDSYNNELNDANVVHKTGNETVDGNKTFISHNVYIKNKDVDISEPTDTRIALNHLYMLDKNDEIAGYFKTEIGPVYQSAAIHARREDGVGGYVDGAVHACVDVNTLKGYGKTSNRPYAEASGDDILAKIHVGGIPELVHTTGNEKISGTKAFTSILQSETATNISGLTRKYTDIDITDTTRTTETDGVAMAVLDKNDVVIARFVTRVMPDNQTKLIVLLRNRNGTMKNVVIAESD